VTACGCWCDCQAYSGLTGRAKGLGRKGLMEITTLVTPATLLASHRKLIAQKYDEVRRGSPVDLLPRRT
jgi:hypothetical protein